MNTNQILKSIKEHGIYDTIANSYYQIDKQELAQIIKELDFKLYTLSYTTIEYNRHVAGIVEELEQLWKEEEKE